MSGWVSIHRKMMEGKKYFSEPFCRNMAWVDMIMLANHDEKTIRVRGILVPIKRGQIGFTSENLAKRWKWSRGKVLRFLTELQTEQQIVQQKNNVTTLITILNYSQYQNNGTAKNTTNDTASRTTNGTTERQQTDINNNVNKDNNLFIVKPTEIFHEKNESDGKQLNANYPQGYSVWNNGLDKELQEDYQSRKKNS